LDRINTLLGLVDGDTMSDINKLKVELESAVYMVSTALIKVSSKKILYPLILESYKNVDLLIENFM
jgi:hypothetical protein